MSILSLIFAYYSDERLAVTRSTARLRELLTQEISRVFEREGLTITNEVNGGYSVNFPDFILSVQDYTKLSRSKIKTQCIFIYLVTLPKTV